MEVLAAGFSRLWLLVGYSGAEHCIADAFYLGVSQFSWQALGYLGLAVLGNTAGSIAIHWLQVGAEKIFEIPTDL